MDGITKDKFKNLSLKEKLQWLLTYYGLTAAAFVVGIIVVVALATTVFGEKNEPDVRIICLDDHMSYDNADSIREELLGLFEGEMEIELTSYLKSDPTNQQAFAVRLAADNLDVVVVTKDYFDSMEESGFIKDWKLIPKDGNYARNTVFEEGAEGLLEDMYLVIPVNGLQQDEAVMTPIISYFLE
ncbi:MAG: hypothetical protein HUJ98_13995 [Bacteroidaceae bacterium]|nr:hypothetical protein [Bacteroidaceae bacterium]